MLPAIALATVLAQTTAPMPVTELISSVKTIAPGRPFTVALHMKLPEGWHNYYSNPGEAGAPTTITWTLPAGYSAGPIQWPLPKRIVTNTIPMYGYDGDLWLSSTITPSAKPATGTVTLKAKAEWLLCAATCVPQKADLELKLKVGKRLVYNSALGLAKAVKQLPSRHIPWSIAAVATDKGVSLTVQHKGKLPEGITFFPSDPDSFTADTVKYTKTPHGFQLLMPLSRYATKSPKRLTGILFIPGQHSYWVDTPVAS